MTDNDSRQTSRRPARPSTNNQKNPVGDDCQLDRRHCQTSG